MTKYLPPTLLALFVPRPPSKFWPPQNKLVCERKRSQISGVAEYVGLFENPKDTPAKPIIETREQELERKKKAKQEREALKVEQGIALWKPEKNPKATTDPFKTLFVGRLNYETEESQLKLKFERYGKIQKIVMVKDLNGKPRGYAFIEFKHRADMTDAYKKADGTKIDGRRVVVDYERGRTVKTWLPRRFGGGKGHTRDEKKPKDRSRGERNSRSHSRHSHDRSFSYSQSHHRYKSPRSNSRRR